MHPRFLHRAPTLFSLFVFIREISHVCFFFQQKTRVVFGHRSLLRISKLLLWAPVAGGAGFHNMMDAPFTKLVAVYELVLLRDGNCRVTGRGALKQMDFHSQKADFTLFCRLKGLPDLCLSLLKTKQRNCAAILKLATLQLISSDWLLKKKRFKFKFFMQL